MSQDPKNIVLISASPKIGEPAASDLLAAIQEDRMKADGISLTRINVRQCLTKKDCGTAFADMLQADALVFTFPLYFFCLPGMLMRFLQDYQQYYGQHADLARKARVFAVVNCGFPEAGINEEAVRVIQSFSAKVDAKFRFGVMIGGGGMLLGAKDAPVLKKTMAELNRAFDLMTQDILNEGDDPLADVLIPVSFPRRLYFFMGNRGWISSASKNDLKKKDLYRKPYRSK
jgi:multimeric flavodoxin WrbA